MKVNIKGLVFTGFAAAILSANAMAANDASAINTVTSKSYVDAKVVNNLDSSAIDKAPSQGAVNTALANKQIKTTGQVYKVGYNETWANIDSAVKVPASGSYLTMDTSAGDGSVTLNVNATTDTSLDSADSGEADYSKIPTAGAVKAYVDAQSNVANFVEDAINSGTTDKAPSEDAVYEALALKQNASTAVTHTQDSAVGSATVPVYIDSTGAAQPTTLGSAATSNVSTGITGTDTGLTTGGQVHDYVAAQLNDSSLVGDGALTVKINGTSATGTYTANQSGASELVFTGIEETANKLTGSDTSTIDSHSTDATSYPSAAAVYNYVQGITHGNNIPARNPSVCDTSTYDNAPCALVAEADGLHWRTMATANHAGGELGDLVQP